MDPLKPVLRRALRSRFLAVCLIVDPSAYHILTYSTAASAGQVRTVTEVSASVFTSASCQLEE
jgi:hypothetical protein